MQYYKRNKFIIIFNSYDCGSKWVRKKQMIWEQKIWIQVPDLESRGLVASGKS